MIVDVSRKNKSFESLMYDKEQVVFLDANFFIPPDKTKLCSKCRPISFNIFKEIWLDPIFSEFTGLAIHEAVYDELVGDICKEYVNLKKEAKPSRLRVFFDSELSDKENALMISCLNKIAEHSCYDPIVNNSHDRGEVKSLAFMRAKNFLFFASNDNMPIRLIEEAEKLGTGLEEQGIIKMYEIIYYLYNTQKYNNEKLKALYKYQYRLTQKEKCDNPDWGVFIESMDSLYK